MGAKFYTPDEIAALMKVSPTTIRRMCQDGEIQAVRFGRQWRISEDDFMISLGAMVVAKTVDGNETSENGEGEND